MPGSASESDSAPSTPTQGRGRSGSWLKKGGSTLKKESKIEKKARLKAEKEKKKADKAEKKRQEKERRKDKKGGKKPVASSQGPTNFSHDMHCSFSPVTGFEIKGIPPAWKQLFKDAGIKEADLKDPETAMFILGVLADNLSANARAAAERKTAPASAPPAPAKKESKSKSGVPPPPSKSSAPPPPAPPPPPAAPPPPGPPPPGGAPNLAAKAAPAAGLSLAEQLAKKQELKHVDHEQVKQERIEASGVLPAIEDPTHMVKVLQAAMLSRRGATAADSDDEGEDDWSDEDDDW